MRFLIQISAAMLLTGAVITAADAEDAALLRTPKDKINYGIGVEIARNYRNLGVELDPELVLRGMKDAAVGGQLLIPEKELRNILITVQSELRRKQAVAKKIGAAGKELPDKAVESAVLPGK